MQHIDAKKEDYSMFIDRIILFLRIGPNLFLLQLFKDVPIQATYKNSSTGNIT